MKIKIPYALIDAFCHLKKSTLDILYILLYLIECEAPDQSSNLKYEISPEKYKNLFLLKNSHSVFQKLRDDAHNIYSLNNYILINLENGQQMIKLFERIDYDYNCCVIKLSLHHEFKEAVLKLLSPNKNYVLVDLKSVLAFKSEYAKRYYPLLIKFIGTPMTFSALGSSHGKSYHRIEPIENFRKSLEIPASYKANNLKHLTSNITTEISENSPYDVSFDFNFVKSRGRSGKITHICFIVQPKEKKLPTTPKVVKPPMKYKKQNIFSKGMIIGNTTDYEAAIAKKFLN